MILSSCSFSTTVRGIKIVMSLEDVGVCLGVPSEGGIISHRFTPDTEGWENFNNLRFYFSMSRISEQEFYVRHARSNSTKLFLSSKNLSDVDGVYKHTDAENVYVPPPASEGGYTRWNIKSGDNSLWCQVMKGKYDRSNNQFHEVEDKVHDSNLWKNIVSVWPVMNDMVYWAIGNGEKVNSWEDYWVQPEIYLSSLRSYLYYAHQVVRVDNLVDSNGEWDLERLSSLLP
ncbi:hypothetical protein KIW84_010977 [Lathyrus oleraceus]|uniref:Uncharacterized protein n=1 Tax=Pisum sativum TaxID=3888 RepID=A0A9D4YML0_PEA|nr:hypothetical protein KIW84_010977 [Pisum sativum]